MYVLVIKTLSLIVNSSKTPQALPEARASPKSLGSRLRDAHARRAPGHAATIRFGPAHLATPNPSSAGRDGGSTCSNLSYSLLRDIQRGSTNTRLTYRSRDSRKFLISFNFRSIDGRERKTLPGCSQVEVRLKVRCAIREESRDPTDGPADARDARPVRGVPPQRAPCRRSEPHAGCGAAPRGLSDSATSTRRHCAVSSARRSAFARI